ncbi:hypothetical protein [Streptomyces sp. TRM68416]|uniref:hypothetical protein n=1 Tax=Streptomyces sp. TRM68416 TaxID=2758412 RepID=UPI001661A393|nr:hypothetical protein [Streptomyces sp. TRM68416]MBD0841455.1 hypothetical protein [Streptomyces sp. TRM68416]
MIRRYSIPLLVHLLIGIPTIPVVLCVRWYAAHGHCDDSDLGRRDLAGCTYDQIENSGLVLVLLGLFGLLVLLLVLLADVLLPLIRERPLGPWLLTLPAVLVPYVVLDAAA